MQLPGARLDALILDGPVPPNRWALENNGFWVSQVATDVVQSCVDLSPICALRLGTMAHLPKLLFDALNDGTLACAAQLPWLTPLVAANYNSYMAAYGVLRWVLGVGVGW